MNNGAAISDRVPTQKGSLLVLVACEFSGIVRDAFAALGHDAWSCDLLPSESEGKHIEGDIQHWQIGRPKEISWETDEWCPGTGKNDPGHPAREYRTISDKDQPWDLLIAFPPCTFLAVSGARWFKDRIQQQSAALAFVGWLMAAPIKHVALENPIGVISSHIRKPDQIIQPWQFGHGETKATYLWLKNLPKLIPTDIVSGRVARVHRASPGPDRWKERSRTLPGIAKAMAEQWSAFCVSQLECSHAVRVSSPNPPSSSLEQ